jgi:hypothetical protein
MVYEEVDAAVPAEGGEPAGFGDVAGSAEAVPVQRGVAQAGHDLRGSGGAHGGAVLVEGDIADPGVGPP